MPQVWDAVVVGAGPAGCIAADRLIGAGRQVLLLDAGPRPNPGEQLKEVDRRAWPFKVVGESFDWYRTHAVGGRCHLWGSWCYRFPNHVFERGGWPFEGRSLDTSYRAAESKLNLRRGELSRRFSELGKELGLQIHPKVGARMADDSIWTPLALPLSRQVRTYSPAMHLTHQSGRAKTLVYFDMLREKPVRVRARSFILAASPIETARMLMCSDLGKEAGNVGQGLVDHMVASYVLLEPAPPEPVRDPLAASALVESFVNLDEDSRRDYPGGFTIELTGPVSLESIDIERMVPSNEQDSWRATQIHAMGECFPHAGRFVTLTNTLEDLTGRPVPEIHVAWTKAEELMAQDMKQACSQLADTLAIPGSKLIKFTDPLTPGAGHEAGTCAMGLELPAPSTPKGRLRCLDNVWVADASTMPTTGDRHPTLTILAQAVRAADDCHRRLDRI